MKPAAFLFDNDGVLIDSSALHWHSWELMMGEEPALKMDEKGFFKGFGKRNDLILQEVAPNSSAETRKRWAERKEELFRQCAEGHISLLPGMETFLKQVVKAKMPRIIASSTPVKNLEMYLKCTVLGQYFDQYISAEQVARGKPAPDIFIAAARELGFDPKDCVVFEDAPAGIAAGKAAGCFVVALATTHHPEQLEHYDLLYSSAKDLNLQEIEGAFIVWKHGNDTP